MIPRSTETDASASSSSSPSISSISFQEAIETLKAMFHGFDEDVLKNTLRDNSGNMELTVDVLLKISRSPSPKRSVAAAIVGDSEDGTPESGKSTKVTERITTVNATIFVPCFRRRKRRVRLPDGFLDGFLHKRRASSTQEDEDAILAQMLQNRMYTDELNSLPEFRQYRPSNTRRNNTVSSTNTNRRGDDDSATRRPSASGQFWKSLSSSAREKWDKLAAKFRRQRERGNSSGSNGDPAVLRALDSDGGATMYETLLQEDDCIEPLGGGSGENADAVAGYRPPDDDDAPALVSVEVGDGDDKPGAVLI
eukprot:g2937.t1